MSMNFATDVVVNTGHTLTVNGKEVAPAIISDTDKTFVHTGLSNVRKITFHGNEYAFRTCRYANEKNLVPTYDRTYTTIGVEVQCVDHFVIMNGTGTSTANTNAFDELGDTIPAGNYIAYIYINANETVISISKTFEIVAYYTDDTTETFSKSADVNDITIDMTFAKDVKRLRIRPGIRQDVVYTDYTFWVGVYSEDVVITDTNLTVQDESTVDYVAQISDATIDTMQHESVVSYIEDTKTYVDEHSTDMVGATSSVAGTHGLVPAPSAGDQDKVLSGAGTWVTPFSKTYDTIPEAFHEKEWEGSLNNFGGNLVWTDGTDFYYSGGAISQYILNKNTGEWESQVWQGYTAIIGNDVWTDGTDIYYSNGTPQYVLDKATSTWTAKTWTGLEENLFGDYIWTDGTDIYYSYGSSQYVLDKSTSTWLAKTWTGLTVFYGCYVWTDGVYIYYSNTTSQYVLDKATSTWSEKTWTGLTNFLGTKIWMNGGNVYYSYNATQYVLNRATSTWSQKTWTGLTSFDGEKIWTDGALIYYSLGSTQYVLTFGDSTGVLFGTNGEFEKVTLEEFKKQASAVLMSSTAFSIPSEGNTVAYLMDGMTADYQLVRWNFSSSSENCPPASLQWQTAPGCFAVTNVSGTTDETIQPVFVRATISAITAYT